MYPNMLVRDTTTTPGPYGVVSGEPQPWWPGDTLHWESVGAALWSLHRLMGGVFAQGCRAHCGVQGKSIWGLHKADYGKSEEGLEVGKGKVQDNL